MREYHQGLRVSRNEDNIPAGCSKRTFSKTAASKADTYPLEYAERLSEVRTILADFFSILSEKLSQDIAKLRQSWYNSDPVPV
jgi:hypothetical protein